MWNGEVLKSLRQKRGITAQALAQQMGVSRPYISQLEGGQRRPGDTFIRKLATYFDVPAKTFHQLRVITCPVPQTDLQEVTIGNKQADNPTVKERTQADGKEYNQYTLSMLLGLISGLLNDVKAAVISACDTIPTGVMTGKVQLHISDLESVGTYQLVYTREWLSLRISGCDLLGALRSCYTLTDQLPHVELADTTGENNANHRELIWFTAYESVYMQYLQCLMWERQGKKVDVLDRILAAYYPHGTDYFGRGKGEKEK